MATLKDHQQAMVDLMAHGSAIPASAMRLAHAMHDVLEVLASGRISTTSVASLMLNDATTPGLNDKALAGDIDACRPKDTMFDRARAAERRVKELENTVKQLRASNATLRAERDDATAKLGRGLRGVVEYQEQAGCRKPDTQVCEHYETVWEHVLGELHETKRCCACGASVGQREVRV